MRTQPAPDVAIARTATRQGGVVSHEQLGRLGLSPDAIKHRVRVGRLHRLHRGVYAVGHAVVGVAGRRWAAVLAVGGDAFVSHHSAADAFEIRKSDARLVHITVRGRDGRERRDGIRIHRPHWLPDDEITRLDGLPITTPPRTLLLAPSKRSYRATAAQSTPEASSNGWSRAVRRAPSPAAAGKHRH